MASFEVTNTGNDGYGRIGRLSVPHGPVETPALFPVINLIGGTTEASGGIWRRFRDNIISEDHLQGVMFQAMSFTDYGVSPENLNEYWRSQTFQERFEKLDAPVFIDSGGFKLMNSNTFGTVPEEGGVRNEWGLYTDPRSILGLQIDFGADIIATLDYPIPPKLNDDEKMERMRRSINSAVECLRILENPDRLDNEFTVNTQAATRLRRQISSGDMDNGEPGVFVALHGHDYETINWYVATFLERVEEALIERSFEGFAIGSLVPLRSSTDVLIDIVQGAKDAIPEDRAEEIGLHVFGVGGKQVSLLALLGVDSFDCSSHMQTAQYRKYTHPTTWSHIDIEELDEYLRPNGRYPCDLEHCILCNESEGSIPYELLIEELNLDLGYEKREARKDRGELIKSDYYALLARHNFEVYNQELHRVRKEIEEGTLLKYVMDFARKHDDIKKGLKRAQLRDKRLKEDLERRNAYDLLPGSTLVSNQAKLSRWDAGVETTEARSISLKHNPNSFDLTTRNYIPPEGKDVLLLIPCSQTKPYSESRTHSILFNKLGEHTDRIHKVTISGMYGPVPEQFERDQPVLEYEYVLAKEDRAQIDLIVERVVRYLEQYGSEFDHIVGYVTSKTYREVIERAFEEYGKGEVLPRNPNALQLTEYFRNTNIDELLLRLDKIDDDLQD